MFRYRKVQAIIFIFSCYPLPLPAYHGAMYFLCLMGYLFSCFIMGLGALWLYIEEAADGAIREKSFHEFPGFSGLNVDIRLQDSDCRDKKAKKEIDDRLERDLGFEAANTQCKQAIEYAFKDWRYVNVRLVLLGSPLFTEFIAYQRPLSIECCNILSTIFNVLWFFFWVTVVVAVVRRRPRLVV